MTMSVIARQNRRNTILLIITGIIAGLIYSALSDGFNSLMPHINGIVAGLLLGGYTAFFEIKLFTSRLRRRVPFLPLLFFRIVLYSGMILVCLFLIFSLSRMFWYKMSYLEVLESSEFQNYILKDD